MDKRRAIIVCMYNIEFIDKSTGDKVFTTKDFTSLNYSSLFQNLAFSCSTRFHHLDDSEYSDNLCDCISDIITYINDNQG